MSAAFDQYRTSYASVVQDSISFSGLKHDFFVRAKIDLLADIVSKHFGPDARPALLDIGCGVGIMHDLLRPIVGKLSGTDLSGEALDRARIEHPGVDYRHQSPDGLPWSPAEVDVTLAVCVMHHVPPVERDGLVAEMRRVTRPGGLVILIEHNPWNPLTRLAVARCPFDHDAVLLDAGEGRALLKRGGLTAVDSRHFLLLPIAHKVARTIERLTEALPLGAQYVALGRA